MDKSGKSRKEEIIFTPERKLGRREVKVASAGEERSSRSEKLELAKKGFFGKGRGVCGGGYFFGKKERGGCWGLGGFGLEFG